MNHNPQYIVLFHHFRLFVEAAAKEGIDVALLKGAHLLTSVYPEGEDRGMLADVDFLVREKDFEKTCALLQKEGFERRQVPGREISVSKAEDAGFYLRLSDDKRILFEVHRHLEQTARHPVNYKELWSRARISQFDGVPCMRLAAEDHFLHIAMHMMTDRFTEPQRSLRDLELLVREGEVDLSVVADRAKEWQCRRATYLALTLLKQKCTDLKLDSSIEDLAPPVIVRTVLGHLVPDESGFIFARAGLRKEQAILWPPLTDGLIPLMRYGMFYFYLRLRDFLFS